LRFRAKEIVTLAPFVSREFPALPGSRFDIMPASSPAYADAVAARSTRQLTAGLSKAVQKSAVKSNSWTPKNPPPALRAELGPDVPITRTMIREWVLENEIDRLKDPAAEKDTDVLLLIAGGLVPTEDGDVEYTKALGAELLADKTRIAASVVEESGEEAVASVALGDLWQAWALRIAREEDNYVGTAEASSPNG
jgi:hypothetical protein